MYNMLSRFLRCLFKAAASMGRSLIFPSSLVLATAARSVHCSGLSVMLNENLLSNNKYCLNILTVSLSDERKQLQDET